MAAINETVVYRDSTGRRAMKRKRKNTRNKRRLQLLLLVLGCIIYMYSLLFHTTSKIGAESDINRVTYKYYTSYYVKSGDSLWSIAEDHISQEYRSVKDYIKEIKEINGLKGNMIVEGTYLNIPYYSQDRLI